MVSTVIFSWAVVVAGLWIWSLATLDPLGGTPVRSWFQHHLNSLGVMCRLTALGIPRDRARRLAARWEAVAHPGLYGLQKLRRL
jgi:hypothetical protein